MAKRKGPNKAAAIREYCTAHPDEMPKDVIIGLGKKKITVTSAQVSNVRAELGLGKKRGRKAGTKNAKSGPRRTGKSTIAVNIEPWQAEANHKTPFEMALSLVAVVGSVAEVKKLIDKIEKVGSFDVAKAFGGAVQADEFVAAKRLFAEMTDGSASHG